MEDGKKFNNIYADTPNYKKSLDGATFMVIGCVPTQQVIQEHQYTVYSKLSDNLVDELNIFENYRAITVDPV